LVWRCEALVNIRTGEIVEGYISKSKLRVVQEWLNEGNNRKNVENNFYELNPRLRQQETKNKSYSEKEKNKKKRK